VDTTVAQLGNAKVETGQDIERDAAGVLTDAAGGATGAATTALDQ